LIQGFDHGRFSHRPYGTVSFVGLGPDPAPAAADLSWAILDTPSGSKTRAALNMAAKQGTKGKFGSSANTSSLS
jgi:hypothetical protein